MPAEEVADAVSPPLESFFGGFEYERVEVERSFEERP